MWAGRTLGALALASALTLAAGCDRVLAPEGAVFVVQVVPEESFRIRLTDPQRISEARALLRTGTPRNVSGDLAAGDGGFNAGFRWHLRPETVEFVDFTIEVCDGRPSDVEEDLDYWLNTVRRYCPWGAKVVAEE